MLFIFFFFLGFIFSSSSISLSDTNILFPILYFVIFTFLEIADLSTLFIFAAVASVINPPDFAQFSRNSSLYVIKSPFVVFFYLFKYIFCCFFLQIYFFCTLTTFVVCAILNISNICCVFRFKKIEKKSKKRKKEVWLVMVFLFRS